MIPIIYNGIDSDHWKQAPDNWNRHEVRAKYGIPHHAKVINITASFRPEKNHKGAVKALHMLHNNSHCKPYLLLVGGGLMLNEIKELVNKLHMEEYVKFAGFQQDVRSLYWISDLFSLCSTHVETFSVATMEALACGIPAVLTDTGGATEMIIEGFNGYVCKAVERESHVSLAKSIK